MKTENFEEKSFRKGGRAPQAREGQREGFEGGISKLLLLIFRVRHTLPVCVEHHVERCSGAAASPARTKKPRERQQVRTSVQKWDSPLLRCK